MSVYHLLLVYIPPLILVMVVFFTIRRHKAMIYVLFSTIFSYFMLISPNCENRFQ